MDDGILQCDDYRAYLRHAVEAQKRGNPLWSYASFARALGLKSAASIHKIVRGRRDPSPQLMTRLAGYFDFSPSERAHFVGLVLDQRTGKRAARPALMAPPMAPTAKTPAARSLSEAEFAALSGWWCYAIRQMARWKGFQENPAWVQARLLFPVRRVAIRKALGVMKELGVLSAKGGLVFAGGERGSVALRAFHTQMIDHARQALVTMPPSKRWVHGLTLAMSARREAEARAALEEFVRTFNERFGAADGAGDRVFQLNLQLFPLAQKEEAP